MRGFKKKVKLKVLRAEIQDRKNFKRFESGGFITEASVFFVCGPVFEKFLIRKSEKGKSSVFGELKKKNLRGRRQICIDRLRLCSFKSFQVMNLRKKSSQSGGCAKGYTQKKRERRNLRRESSRPGLGRALYKKIYKGIFNLPIDLVGKIYYPSFR